MRIAGILACAYLLVVVAGCAGRPIHGSTPAAPAPDGAAAAGSIGQEADAVAADAANSDREPDSRVREQLADDASRHADACLALGPQAGPCLYERAVALGLEAKAHPTRALELLKSMLEFLSRAESADAQYDHAGPARVRALVLIRAPGWPLGPGDVDAGVEAARRAVMLQPKYTANLLALAEAQAKSGDTAAAHQSYAMARDLARALAPGADRDEWLKQAEQGLAKK